ncbi:MAG: hypothetical protein HQ557_03570 [Bacteroidetes bacterium]|nr:hypothetical protein [Bacteroidota bacterium]
MTSYEIVKRSVDFTSPERVALKYPTLGNSDIIRLFLQKPRTLRADTAVLNVPDMRKKVVITSGERDEWGTLWENLDGDALGLGQPIDHPIKDWEEDYPGYRMPDPFAEGRFDGLEEALVLAGKDNLWVQLNSQYCIFERLHHVRGFENTLMDLYIDREKIEELSDRLLEFQMGIVKQVVELGKGRIHAIEISDDWGTQNNLMISPDLWREVFKPRYKILIDEMHRNGIYCDFHCCGKINDIMDEFVDLGVDIVNIHQPKLLGIDEIGQKYAGKIAFDVAVDIQETLPTGNRELIEQEVIDLLSKWGTPQGGIIAAEYRFLNAIGATQESFEYSLECFRRHGNFRK